MIRTFVIVVLTIISTYSTAQNPDGYAAAKLPALSRTWQGADYQVVAAAINNKAIPLPRFSSSTGAALLKKITTLENLAFMQSKTLPVESRLQESLTLLPAVNSMAKAYFVAANRGEKVNAEVAALLGFMLRVSSEQARMVDEYVPTIPRDDKYSIRMDGLTRMRSGLTTMFLGAETSLSERQFYTPDDISLLLEAMADTLPSFRSLFASDFLVELHNKLSVHRKNAIRPNDVKSLERMLAALK